MIGSEKANGVKISLIMLKKKKRKRREKVKQSHSLIEMKKGKMFGSQNRPVKKAPSISIEKQGAAMNAAFVDIVHNCRFTREVSVYCPCGTEGPITELRDMVQAIPDTVVVGDWNACRLDTCSIKRMLLGLGYERLPNKVGATFIAARSNKPSELDQALVRDKSWTVLDNPR